MSFFAILDAVPKKRLALQSRNPIFSPKNQPLKMVNPTTIPKMMNPLSNGTGIFPNAWGKKGEGGGLHFQPKAAPKFRIVWSYFPNDSCHLNLEEGGLKPVKGPKM